MTNGELREFLVAIARVEAKVDLVLQMMGAGQFGSAPLSVAGEARRRDMAGSGAELFFRQFTAKQNAALQMVLRGAENSEIAERLGVSPNTAKVHVRVIAGKLGVSNRVQIAMKARGPFDEVDPAVYRVVSGGLPKDWDATYREPDEYAYIYRKGDDDASDAEE